MRVRYSFSSRRTRQIDPTNEHKKPFSHLAQEVIRISDIILEVLDARFIEKTRNIKSEDYIKELGKKIIYVINKSDLVEMSKIKETIENLGLYPYVIVSCKSSIGKRNLRTRIKIEVKKMKIAHAKAHIGVIGYPNTGKSTLINVLAGGGKAHAAAEAGFTKGITKIKLARDILILDTPGVISDEDYPGTQKENLAKTSEIGVKMHSVVKDPQMIVANLMKMYASKLERYYSINSNSDSEIFLEAIGKKHHFLKKGGLIDLDRAARFVIKDWQANKIN